MRPNLKLTLDPAERTALRSLTAEEREALVDEMLVTVRDDLAWILALEAARSDALERATVPSPPARRAAKR
jgi:hypothetical protein